MERELKKRKSARLHGFDYSTRGFYFLTICTQNRRNILSKIVGEGLPLPQLTNCGRIVDKWIRQIPQKYQEIDLDCYVIMPNHIHLLVSVMGDDGRGDPSPTVDSVVGWLKYQATKEINKERGITGEKIFQRSFYDHIVRNDDDYDEIYNYIQQNPLRWKFDKLFTEE